MNSSKRIRKIFTAALILFPILNSAHIGQLNFGFGDVVLILSYGLVVVSQKSRMKPRVNTESFQFWVYIFYLAFISVINCITIPSFEFSSILMPIIRYSFYGLILYCNRRYFDYEFGIRLYIDVCVAESLYGLLQFALTLTMGIALPYVLPFTTMEYGSYGADYNATVLWTFQNVDGIRLVGFFPEASHFAQYTILSVVFLLYKRNRNRKDLLKLVIISVSLLLTKSSVGIIAYGFIVVYYMITEKHLSAKKLITRIALLLLAIVAFTTIGSKMDIIGFIRDRISRINEKTYAVSGNIRLVRGLLVYSNAPTSIKIFGIGCGNYVNFIDSFNITTFFDLVMDRTNEYMNAFSILLIRSGIIGTLLFSVFAVKVFKKSNRLQRAIFYIWLELFFTENIFFSPIFVLFVWFMLARFDDN